MANNKLIKSDVMCPYCGTITPILKKQNRKPFSHKRVYCFTCQKYVKGVDIQDKQAAIYNLKEIKSRISSSQRKVFKHLKPKSKVKAKVYRYE